MVQQILTQLIRSWNERHHGSRMNECGQPQPQRWNLLLDSCYGGRDLSRCTQSEVTGESHDFTEIL